MRKRSPQAPRVVVGKKSLADLIEDGWSFGLSSEPATVREHLDGSWTVEYPEEGWIQTAPGQQWPVTVSYWPAASGDSAFDLDAAVHHARVVRDGLEPKIERLNEKLRNKRAVTVT